MKIKELISILQKENSDDEVIIRDYCGCLKKLTDIRHSKYSEGHSLVFTSPREKYPCIILEK